VEILGYIASLLIGLALGLLGGGGSILAIPVLIYLFAIEPVRASAYSLFIVGTASLMGTIGKHNEGNVSVRTGVLFGIPTVLAIFSTRKWFLPMIPDVLYQAGGFVLTKRLFMMGFFILLMFAAALSMIRRRSAQQPPPSRRPFSQIALQGVSIGFITGLVGVGGGFLIVPALIMLTGLPYKLAVGTSLLVIAMNCLAGFMGDALNYAMDWPFLLLITGLAVIGMIIGSRMARRVPGATLKRSLGWFILAVAIWVLYRELT